MSLFSRDSDAEEIEYAGRSKDFFGTAEIAFERDPNDKKLATSVGQTTGNTDLSLNLTTYEPKYLGRNEVEFLCTDGIVSRNECAQGLEKIPFGDGVNVYRSVLKDGSFLSPVPNTDQSFQKYDPKNLYDGIPTETIRKVIETVDGYTNNSKINVDILLGSNPQFNGLKGHTLTHDYSLSVVVRPNNENGRIVILLNVDALKQNKTGQIASEVKLVLNNYCSRTDAEGKRRCLKNSAESSTSNPRTGPPTQLYEFNTTPNLKIDLSKYLFNYGNK